MGARCEPGSIYTWLMNECRFHAAVQGWFDACFARPTDVQRLAWPAIQAGRHALLAAPTGSGKTLAAFLAAIDTLVREGEVLGLPDETRVLYVSPLKALSNDIHRNLEEPLAGIGERLGELSPLSIRSAVRTGDTPAGERARMRRRPPHILVTTPESLYILLTSESGREMLRSVRTVIADELHAVAGNKRGAHLSLSLERLAALCDHAPARIGISATQKPVDAMRAFLLGNRDEDCDVIDTGFVRDRDLQLELAASALQSVMAGEVWAEIYDRLAALTEAHRSTLVFVNTRRLAERVARHLAERIGDEYVTAHHGSLSREHRLDAEARLKAGRLRALVATASLELGIDIGDVDLVCQLGSPRAIATLLQRVGRSGHGVGELPKGRLFPLSRDDLVECAALLDAVRRDELDAIRPVGPALDVLAQQLVAEASAREWTTDELFLLAKFATPYRDLARADFDALIRMLADGYTTRRGRGGRLIHFDAVNGRIRGRRGARLTAMTNGGAIPDQFDYDVVMLPEEIPVGTLNEDFAFESLPGDVFQLGNTSYRILKVQLGKVFVEDARGQPPNIPFWFGEAPGRSDELSFAVSRLRARVAAELENGLEAARRWLERDVGLLPAASEQLVEYLAAARAALGVLPDHENVVFERFFDEMGDTHLVIHSPFGSRLNRAWGLALRKRFCRKFNFELQAAALEDSIVLSLGPTHSFPLEEVASYLAAATVRDVLVQALLAAPMFPVRWRWSASIALAVRRNRNGKRIPPQFQRSDAEDLMAVVFPDQLACAENIAGDREVPDHPLVRQTLHDCLHELMDTGGLEKVLRRITSGDIRVHCRELSSPSPLAQEIITARPFAFLDDAPAEERRTQAIRARHLLEPEDARALAHLDPAAIEAVCAESWPDPRNPDELHDALVLAGFLTARETAQGGDAWRDYFDALTADRRATRAVIPGGETLWVSAERLGQLLEACPGAHTDPPIAPVDGGAPISGCDAALRELVRSRLETLGPVTAGALGAPLGLDRAAILIPLTALEVEGAVMRGHYRNAAGSSPEWCERRLLARIHRRTVNDLRRRVEPVSPAAYMRFLFQWHEIGAARQSGPEAVVRALARLQGFAAPAALWEAALLPARVDGYLRSWLDQLLAGGRYLWLRPRPAATDRSRAGPVRSTPVMLIDRGALAAWLPLLIPEQGAGEDAGLSARARQVRALLRARGAIFFNDLVVQSGLLKTEVEQALSELVAAGLVTSDSFAGLRALITPASRRARFSRPRRAGAVSVDAAGRWSLLDRELAGEPAGEAGEGVEAIALALLERYGVVFRALLQRESRWLPPWRELARVFRRLEARGEIRGGRFVNPFGGEQFAQPGAVERLRRARDGAGASGNVIVAAGDPLNLAGIVTPGPRVPVAARNRVLYRDGSPVAIYAGGEFSWLGAPDAADEWSARNMLLRDDPALTYIAGPGRMA